MRLAGIQRDKMRGTQVIRLLAALTIAALIITALFVTVLGQQDPHPQDQAAPPPLKIIKRLERTQLNESKDPKARVKTTIALAEAHLANAENQTSQHEYDGAAAEAGMYWALVEDAFRFLKTIERDNNARRDMYKRLELSLRAHGTRLSIIRRETPSEYAVWIKEIEELARAGRTEALNSFYGQTVIRPQKPTNEKEAEKKPLNSNSPEPK
jgi:hypothetical protein